MKNSSVVDEHIDLAELLDYFGDYSVPMAFIRNVMVKVGAVERVCDVLSFSVENISEDDSRA